MTYITLIYIAVLGFLCGLPIPVVASRFGKVLPADPGLVLSLLWHKPRMPKNKISPRYALWRYKWQKMIIFSVCWGLIMAGLFACAGVYLGMNYLPWFGLFIVTTGVLMAIDHQYFLLPDFFTVPLLFCGFGFAVSTGFLTPWDSFIGAVFGYILCTLSVWLMHFRLKTAEFGAGDVKMVTALGAWLGYTGVNIALVLSFVFFAVWAGIVRKRTGAFGPALGLAAIIVLFGLYAK